VRLIDSSLDALADGCRDQARRLGNPDPRTHQQRRADALVALFQSVLEGAPLPFIRASASKPQGAGTSRVGTAGRSGTSASDTNDVGGSTTGVSGIATAEMTGAGEAFGGRVVPAGHPAAPATPGLPLDLSSSILAWWLPPALPNQQGRRPQLVVTIGDGTLRGRNDRPGELKGYGPIPAELAREIAGRTGRVTLIPVHRRSRPAHGPGDQANCAEASRRYKPRQTVLDQVTGRFQTCVHPGCSRDAVQCDIDHAVPFAKGGRSCPCNLVPLCRAHHRLKTYGGWSLRLTRPDEPYTPGTIEFRSRLGQRRIEPPPDLPGMPGMPGVPGPSSELPEDEADQVTRVRLREDAWQSELTRGPRSARPAPAQPPDPGEPPF